jgi:hypothetical protein
VERGAVETVKGSYLVCSDTVNRARDTGGGRYRAQTVREMRSEARAHRAPSTVQKSVFLNTPQKWR